MYVYKYIYKLGHEALRGADEFERLRAEEGRITYLDL